MLQKNVSLRPYNTLSVEATAAKFALIDTEERLRELLPIMRKEPTLILGEGSNILFSQDIKALVVANRLKGRSIVRERGNEVIVRVGAGENWHETVLWLCEQGLGGLENLSLIPGTVGAAPVQNIGAYGMEVGKLIHKVEAIRLPTSENFSLLQRSCKFDYRNSIFKTYPQGEVLITAVHLSLTRYIHGYCLDYPDVRETLTRMGVTQLTPSAVAAAITEIRLKKLPYPPECPNAGSFFKNPIISATQMRKLRAQYPLMPVYPTDDEYVVKLSAAWLLENAGFKGKWQGQAQFSPRHALVLTNPEGKATGAELLQLAQQARVAVSQKFEVLLQPEVNIF